MLTNRELRGSSRCLHAISDPGHGSRPRRPASLSAREVAVLIAGATVYAHERRFGGGPAAIYEETTTFEAPRR